MWKKFTACLSDPDPFGVCFSSVFVRMFEPQIVGYFAIILPVDESSR